MKIVKLCANYQQACAHMFTHILTQDGLFSFRQNTELIFIEQKQHLNVITKNPLIP